MYGEVPNVLFNFPYNDRKNLNVIETEGFAIRTYAPGWSVTGVICLRKIPVADAPTVCDVLMIGVPVGWKLLSAE